MVFFLIYSIRSKIGPMFFPDLWCLHDKTIWELRQINVHKTDCTMLPARESGQGCCLPDFSNKAKLSLKVVFIMCSENLDMVFQKIDGLWVSG